MDKQFKLSMICLKQSVRQKLISKSEGGLVGSYSFLEYILKNSS